MTDQLSLEEMLELAARVKEWTYDCSPTTEASYYGHCGTVRLKIAQRSFWGWTFSAEVLLPDRRGRIVVGGPVVGKYTTREKRVRELVNSVRDLYERQTEQSYQADLQTALQEARKHIENPH